ncbi:2-hydroxyacyl-CoA dehydratase, partial [Thermodesulfobacteriota bacterium]
MSEERSAEVKSRTGQSSARGKRMRTSAAVQAYQKEYFLELQDRARQGEPVLFMGANTPHEIAEAMDIPFVVDPWWMAINAAKRLLPYYRELADKRRVEKGYDQMDACGQCSSTLTQLTEQNPEHAAYGGLPKLAAIIQSERFCSAQRKATQIELRDYRSQGFDVPYFALESAAPTPYPHYPNWWEKINDHWDEVIEPYRIDYRVEELKALIKFLEVTTGRTFSESRLAEIMELVNEQEMYWRMARDMIAKTVPAPID